MDPSTAERRVSVNTVKTPRNCRLLLSAFRLLFASAINAATLTQTGSFDITRSHVVPAPVGLGVDLHTTDRGAVNFPLFDPAQGTLTGVTVTVNANSPTNTGLLTYGPAGQVTSLLATESQQATVDLSNGAAGATGPVTGAVNAPINLSNPLGAQLL